MRHALFLVTLLAVGCGQKPAPVIDTPGPEAPGGAGPAPAKPADLIVGKWERVGQADPDEPNLPLEFTKDGKVDLLLFKGTYQFTADDVVVLTLVFANEPLSLKVQIAGDDLELTSLNGEKKGQVSKFRRVAEFSEKYRMPAKAGGTPSGPKTPKTATTKLKEVFTFKGHDVAVNAVCLSPDGELVASGGDDKVIKVWKRATGDMVTTLTGHKRKLMSLAWSPRGDVIASAGDHGEVKLWAVPGWKEVPTKVNEGAYTGINVRFGPAGDRLICSASPFNANPGSVWTGLIRVWDIQADRVVIDLNHDREVMGLAVSPDGGYLAATTRDDYTKVWELPGGKVVFSRKKNTTLGVALSHDGKTLAVGGDAVQLIDWGEGGGAMGRKLKCESYPDHIEFLGDHTLAASYSRGVKIIDNKTGEPVAEASGHAADIKAMAVSDDGKWLTTGGNDSLVKVWDISAYGTARPKVLVTPAAKQPGDTTGVPTLPKTPDTPPATIPEPKAGGFDPKDTKTPDLPPVKDPDPPANLPTFDPVKSEKPVVLTGHVGRVISVAFSPDGERVAAVALDQSAGRPLLREGEVAIWSLRTGQVERRMSMTGPVPNDLDKARVAFGRDGRKVAVATGSTLKVWDAATGRAEADHYDFMSFRAVDVGSSPDGTRWIVVGEKGGAGVTVRTWDTATGKKGESVETGIKLGSSGTLALSPDGTHVAVLSEQAKDGKTKYQLKLLDSKTGQAVGAVDLPLTELGSDGLLKFDVGGRRIAVALKGNVLVCDPIRGTAHPLPKGDGVVDLAFSVEGNRLAVVGQKAVGVIDPTTGKDVVSLPVAVSPAWKTIYDDHLKAPTTCSAFSPDGRYFAVGSGATVQVWERKDGATKAVQKAPTIQARPEEKGRIEPKAGDVDRKDDAKLDLPVPLPKTNDLPSQPVPEAKKDTLPPPKEVK